MGLENKTLLDLANETDEAKFKEGFSKLKEDEQKQVTSHLAEEADKSRKEVIATRAEKQRQQDLADEAKRKADLETGNKDKSFEQRYREENLSRAFETVFTDMNVTKDEDRQAIREQFKRLDSGAVTVENIQKDIRKSVLAAKPDEFIGAFQQAQEFQKNADEFNRSQAGNMGGNTTDEDKGKQYSKEARDMVATANRRGTKLTLEEAENYIQKGATRTIR